MYATHGGGCLPNTSCIYNNVRIYMYIYMYMYVNINACTLYNVQCVPEKKQSTIKVSK